MAAAAGAVSPGGIVEYPVSGSPQLSGITEAAGALWFTDGTAIARITPSGSITSFPGPTPGGHAIDWNGITLGPDGNLWATGMVVGGGGAIAPFSTSTDTFGTVYSSGLQTHSDPTVITPGPSGTGTLWFIDNGVPYGGSDDIGEITTSGTIDEYSDVPPDLNGIVTVGANVYVSAAADLGPGAIDLFNQMTDAAEQLVSTSTDPEFDPGGLAADSNGDLWFPLDGGANPWSGQNKGIGEMQGVGEMPPTYTITAYSTGLQTSDESDPTQIALGPNGDMYFADDGTAAGGVPALGQVTPTGTISEFTSGLAGSSAPAAITAGPDGNVWFTDSGTASIGELDLVTSSPPATSSSSPMGTTTGSPPSPPPPSPSPTLVAPKLSDLTQLHAKWVEKGYKHGPPVGTRFSFDLNETASLKLTFTAELPGRREGKHGCVARTHANRHDPKCMRTGSSSSLPKDGIEGPNSIPFTGKTSAHASLAPGNYELVITATASGESTSSTPLHFTIEAPPK